MRRVLLITICLGISCILSQFGICSENDSKYPLNISVKIGNGTIVNPTLIWETQDKLPFKELASMTIIVINTDTKKGQTIFLIQDMNKGKVAKKDHIVDLGMHDPGEYEVWIENMMNKMKFSNKVIFKVK